MSFYHRAHELLALRQAGAAIADLAAQAGWTYSSTETLISKARNGTLRHPETPRLGGWDDDMDKVLRDYWHKENSHRIADRIYQKTRRHVSHWAVNSRAKRLGLKKPGTRNSWQEKNR